MDTSPFVPAIIQALSYQGKIRAMPEHSEMEIFIYNKQYFSDAGLDPENPPSTWDELYKAAPGLTFEVYMDKGGDFRYRMVDESGTNLGGSLKGYDKKEDVLKVINTIKKEAASAKIEDETTKKK